MVEFSDPLVWVIGGAALIIVTLLLIFFKVFGEEPRSGVRIKILTEVLSLLK